MSEILAQLKEVVENTFSVEAGIFITITIAVFKVSNRLHIKCRRHPLTLPLVVTAIVLGVVLLLLDIEVTRYQQATSVIHWLLGPVTVALAVPLYHQWERITKLGWRLWLAIFAGGIFAPVLAWAVLILFNAPAALSLTMLVKSITTPLAMETAAQTGGVPAIAAVFVISTGVVGAVVAPWVFRLLGQVHPEAQGVALGTVAHAIGTAKALQLSEVTGALAAIALSLNGIMTAFILPLVISTLE